MSETTETTTYEISLHRDLSDKTFRQTISYIKQLPGTASFDPQSKTWTVEGDAAEITGDWTWDAYVARYCDIETV